MKAQTSKTQTPLMRRRREFLGDDAPKRGKASITGFFGI
jgi:hypothetical protein